MSENKPSIPKGTRDFTPTEMAGRNYIFQTVKSVFEKYGFMPIETPAMENLSTLLGKYGDEGDKLLFRILNSGDYLSKIDEKELNKTNSSGLSSKILRQRIKIRPYSTICAFCSTAQRRNKLSV
jgi:histidyl-tRNA synthetase